MVGREQIEIGRSSRCRGVQSDSIIHGDRKRRRSRRRRRPYFDVTGGAEAGNNAQIMHKTSTLTIDWLISHLSISL